MVAERVDAWEIEFPAYRRELFLAKIDAANRRLERAGASTRFSPILESFQKRVRLEREDDAIPVTSMAVYEPWVRATLESLDLTIGDYTFVAALVREEAGYTVHAAPGQNLDGWTRPAVEDDHCDHCGVDRRRTRLYVIRERATGRLVQIGHSCLELYLGLHPKGLWALQFGEELQEFADQDGGSGFAPTDYGVPVRQVLAYAWVFSSEGRDYRSSKVRDWGGSPTVDVVRTALFVPPRPPYRPTPEAMAEYRSFLKMIAEADRVYREEADLLDAICASVEAVKAGTDYGDNLRTILAGENVSGRNVGILASLVAVYARERELAVQRARAPKPAAGYLAPVKTRIKSEIRLTIRTVRYWDNGYGVTTFLVGYTPEQHCVVWKASGHHNLSAGDVLVLSAATVKAHEVYEGTDQTVITRAVIDHVETATTEEEEK